MMSETSSPSDPSPPDPIAQEVQTIANRFDVAPCGQCSTCQRYFPCEQIFVLQIQYHAGYQDTGRLICFECHRHMNLRAYQARELSRSEIAAALWDWLSQRHLLQAKADKRGNPG